MAVEKLDVLAGLATFGWAAMVAVWYATGRKKGEELRTGREESALVTREAITAAYASLDRAGNWLVRKKVSPDTLTYAGLGVTAIAALLASAMRPGLAALAAMTAGALDMLDGLVASRSQRSSVRGSILDSSIDRYADFLLLLGIAMGLESRTGLLASILAMHGSYMISYLQAKSEAVSVKLPSVGMKRPERMAILVAGLALSSVAEKAGDRPLVWAVVVVAALANLSAIRRLRALLANAASARSGANP